jgi:ribosome maturation protein SDO1
MVKLEDAVIARLERGQNKFEILVEPNLALELKKGNKVNFDELLAIDSVFKDARKGELQSEALIKEAFKTNDINEIARIIITKGQVQITTEQRRELIEKKRKEIINYISINALNPQTKAPHPPQRIENAMNELNIHVDPFKSVDEQVTEIISKLKKLLPITIEKIRIAVKIPAQYSAKALNALHSFEIKKQEWQSDGSLIVLFELPAGLKIDLINKANKLTQGEAIVKILEE